MIALIAVVAFSLTAVPVAELTDEPGRWDGQEVTIVGEIIGDYSIRGDVVWFQLNDDAYAQVPLAERGTPAGGNTGIGVRLPRARWSADWGDPGAYSVRGPVVEITGTYLHNSGSHQGETFIDGRTVRLIEASRAIETRPASPLAALVGVVLGAVGLVLYRVGRRPRYRRV